MKSRYEINRKLESTSLVTLLNRATGVLLLVAIVAVGVRIQPAAAGIEPAVPQGMNPQEVAAAIKANAQALKIFNYQQRMQLQLKGETKKVPLTQMTHDMYGNVQKTQLSEEPADAPPSGGRLKQRVVARKKGEFKDMMQEIATLVTSYTELPPDQLHAALQKASFSPGEGDMGGSVQVQMQNVIQQGDSMTIWIDRNAMLFRRAVIATTYEGNPVTTTANYAMLPTGQVHMAQAILNYPKKQVVVQLDNMNYSK